MCFNEALGRLETNVFDIPRDDANLWGKYYYVIQANPIRIDPTTAGARQANLLLSLC